MTRRLLKGSGAAVVIGGAALAWGFVSDPVQAAYSYWFAFASAFTLVVGMLFVLMVGHAANAKWFTPLRRASEAVVMTMPVLSAAGLVGMSFLEFLFPWTHVEELPRLVRHHVEEKASWFTPEFFVGRTIGYLALFTLFAELLLYWSRKQDRISKQAEAIRLRQRMSGLSSVGLLLLALVLTFAATDWFMSLDPEYFSHLYGVYVFAGGFLAAWGLLGALAVVAHVRKLWPEELAAEHWHAVGRLQLGMVIFWAYIGWAQVLQQWIANLPVEVLWYRDRWTGGWQWIGVALVLLHWALPFFWLLNRRLKRHPKSVVVVGVYLTCVHLLDVHYLIMPALYPGRLELSWMSPAALCLVFGACLFFSVLRSRTLSAVPKNDPMYPAGLRYQSES